LSRSATSDRDVWQAALLIVKRYGDDAVPEASEQAVLTWINDNPPRASLLLNRVSLVWEGAGWDNQGLSAGRLSGLVPRASGAPSETAWTIRGCHPL
jgi:hypothetical protein